MPMQDGSGPLGAGPMTGRGFGPCGGGYRRVGGYGRGFRRAGYGYGRGFRRFWSVNRVSKEDLEDEKELLQQELKEVTDELNSLKKNKKIKE